MEVVKNQPKKIQEFSTGAKREDKSRKPFVHNLKGYTRIRFGYHMTKNAPNHGDSNWEKGIPDKSYSDSIDRHWAQWLDGDRSEDHLSAIIFGIQGLMINEKNQGIPADHYFNPPEEEKKEWFEGPKML